MRRRLLLVTGALLLVVVLVVGLLQAGSSSEPVGPEPAGAGTFDLEAAKAQLAGAPAPLAALHAQSSELLDGGTSAFEARLRELRGYPVVVNKWAAWCPPCRLEFPFFQSQATKLGKQVAFIGVDSKDPSASAREFLDDFPVPYPSYEDPDVKIARSMKAGVGWPTTVFYDEQGRMETMRAGGYANEEALAKDIETYLGVGG